MVYQGEGPIGFKAQLTTEDSWTVQSNGIGSMELDQIMLGNKKALGLSVEEPPSHSASS